jgi:hypothetical protein
MSGMDTQTIGLPSISVTARRAPDPNELTIIVNDKRIGGWLRSRVTCGIERCPISVLAMSARSCWVMTWY